MSVFVVIFCFTVYILTGLFMIIVIKTADKDDSYDEKDFRLAIVWPLVLVIVLYLGLERGISFLIQKIVSWLLYKNHKQEKNEKD